LKKLARIYPLFSSSKGNCIYFGDGENGILIDCGVSCKRICAALAENGLSPSAVRAVFITHTHSDHIKGLSVFLKKYPVPLYAQQTNLDILFEKGKLPEGTLCFPVEKSETAVRGFTVTAFPTPHDAPASCGYRVKYPDGKTAALCTDLGKITPEVWENITGTDLVMLESNYDSQMLKNGSYPAELKRRIASDFGHLSNSECGRRLAMLAENGTIHFVLGHLSEENNTPQAAYDSAVSSLLPRIFKQDYMLYIAPPEGGKAVVF
jgi:phosphoribosyl 1,2-cyclic phosphodiesterase